MAIALAVEANELKLDKFIIKEQVGDHMENNLEHSFEGLTLNDLNYSSESLTKDSPEEALVQGHDVAYPIQELVQHPSSCTFNVDSNTSHLGSNIDNWILGTSTDTGVQGSRVPVVQRSTLAARSSFNMARVWCVLALALPLFTSNGTLPWRCTPSIVLNSAELFLTNVASVVTRARAHVSRIAQEQMTRDCFAQVMDIVLVIYAFGFLILSLYEASIIG